MARATDCVCHTSSWEVITGGEVAPVCLNSQARLDKWNRGLSVMVLRISGAPYCWIASSTAARKKSVSIEMDTRQENTRRECQRALVLPEVERFDSHADHQRRDG